MLAVVLGERDPAAGVERPGFVGPAVGDRPPRQLPGAFGLVVDEHLRELVEAGDDALEVTGALRELETLFVSCSGHRDVASLSVDVATTDDRVADLARPGLAVDRDRGRVVRAR